MSMPADKFIYVAISHAATGILQLLILGISKPSSSCYQLSAACKLSLYIAVYHYMHAPGVENLGGQRGQSPLHFARWAMAGGRAPPLFAICLTGYC